MRTLILLLTIALYINMANNVVFNTIMNCHLFSQISQSEINRCINDIVAAIRTENMQDKESENKWGVIRLEPMPVGNFSIKLNENSLNIDAVFIDVLLHGISNYTITNIDAKYEDRNATISVFIPEIFAEGTYIIKGNLFLVPMDGKGDFWIQIDKIDLRIFSRIVANKENPEFLGIQDAVSDVKIGKATTQLENLFKKDSILDETVHHFINNNDQFLLGQVLPLLQRRISEMLETTINKIFLNIPIKAVYLDGKV